MTENSNRPLINYHSHTWRCQHAGGTEEGYVLEALRTGYAVFGFADHTPWPYESGFVSTVRMRLAQLDDYIATVRGLAAKYADRILIPLGLECEAFPQYMGWLADLKAEKLDYLILGNHYDATDDGDHNALSDRGGFRFGNSTRAAEIRRYCDRTVAGMRTGLFDCVAHPDLFCCSYAKFDADCAAVSRELCAAARALDIPLEYNLLGVQNQARVPRPEGLGYPCRGFWEIAAETGCRAIVGLDAHQTAHVARRDLFDDALTFLNALNIDVLRHLDGAALYREP